MNTKHKKNLIISLTTATLLSTAATIPSMAFGEVTNTGNFNATISSSNDYTSWYNEQWNNKDSGELDTGKIALTPGQKETDLNFAWYSENVGTPKIKISTNKDMSNATIVTGKAKQIDKKNLVKSYKAANHVELKNYLKENTTYYYQYTTDDTYSETYEYKTYSFKNFQAILVGDPQIGASGGNKTPNEDDLDIAINTFSWNQTLTTANKVAPKASFILSAGDQIDWSQNDDNGQGNIIREQEYAGFLYPKLLRTIPLATTIGNHESKVDDYSLHFNNPNASHLGQTESGGDFYYSYGDTLFISLNSNSRNVAEHRQLMKEAIASHKDAKWKVVMFHHDIYGSGAPHADTDGANLRILFAPLMDEFNIDVCLTGHDHSYARTFQIKDGKVMDTKGTNADATSKSHNPEGTLYIAAGSATGSKFYGLTTTRQYYIAERSNQPVPTFSTIDFSNDALTIKTYDHKGNKYAYDVTLTKDNQKTKLETAYDDLKSIDKDTITTGSQNRIDEALQNYNKALDHRDDTKAIEILQNKFNQSDDPLDYYARANDGQYKNPQDKALIKGFSQLLDKTRYENATNQIVTKATQKQFTQKLEEVKKEIVTKDEYNHLLQELDKALAVDKTKYTKESYEAYISELNKLKASLDESQITKSSLKQLTAQLAKQKENLIPSKQESKPNNTTSQNNNTNNNTTSNKPTNNNQSTQTNNSTQTQQPVKTGDTQPILLSIFTLVASLFGFIKFKKRHIKE